MSGRFRGSWATWAGGPAMTDRHQSRQWERSTNRRLTTHARQAVKAMRQVEYSALVWVDSVRQCVEDRLGIGPDDMRALHHPVYNAPLDRWSKLRQLADQTELAVQGLQATQATTSHSPSFGACLVQPEQEAER